MQLAQTLHGYGVREGDIVAIHANRSIEAIVSMLATHAAGAAFLPLEVSSLSIDGFICSRTRACDLF